MERNIEKIRRLEGRIRSLQQENIALMKERDEVAAGAEELSALTDAVVTQIALCYGEDGEDGEKLMRLPVLDVGNLRDSYEISVTIREDGVRVLSVRKAEDNDGE